MRKCEDSQRLSFLFYFLRSEKYAMVKGMENFDKGNLIFGAVILLFVLQGAMVFFIWQTSKRITRFFNGKDGKSIEKVLEYEMRKMKKTEEDIKKLVDNMKWIEDISKKSVHKVGVMRYNPFREIGGDQSFSIALLDYKDDGVIVSSLHAQDGTRVYAKPISKGKSRYQLTGEEDEALQKAYGKEKGTTK